LSGDASTLEVTVSLKILEKLSLVLPMDTSVSAPGPSALLVHAKILPRIETILGLLADQYYTSGKRSNTNSCRDYYGHTVVGPAVDFSLSHACPSGMTCSPCARSASIVGPLLHVQYDNGEERVYVETPSGLVSVGIVRKLSDILSRKCHTYTDVGNLSPKERLETLRGLEGELRCILEGDELGFIPKNKLIMTTTRQAIDPKTKTVKYGHLYTRTYTDILAGIQAHTGLGVEEAIIKALIYTTATRYCNRCVAKPRIVGLGKGRRPTQLNIKVEETSSPLLPLPSGGARSATCKAILTLTETPLTPETYSVLQGQAACITGLTGEKPGIVLHYYGYGVVDGDKLVHVKYDPRPALPAGTVVIGYLPNALKSGYVRDFEVFGRKYRIYYGVPVSLVERLGKAVSR